MENLIREQYEIYEAIQKININFNKDSESRKTPEYIKKRITNLNELWNKFEQNDEALEKSENKSHEYFTSNVYGGVHQYFLSTKLLISSFKAKSDTKDKQSSTSSESYFSEEQDLEEPGEQARSEASKIIPPQLPKQNNRGIESKTDELLKKQASNFRAFTRTVSNINLENVCEKWEFEDLLRNLEARWKIIDAAHWELDSELEGSSNNIYEKAFSTHEKTYNQMKRAINSKMWSVSHRDKFTPKINIPEFSGDYNRWTSFKDLFYESIHNNPSLSNAQKMQFLKSKVKGEAERLIQHLSISSENYNTCWDLLNNRFNNTKLIFNSHINIMIEIPSSKQQSLSHIKKIHDTTNECINAVKNLGVDTSSWDPLIVHLMSLKLDTQTYNEYMDSLKNKRDLPTLKEYLEFLESKFTSMETAHRKQESARPQTASSSSNRPTFGANNQKSNYFKRPFLSNQVMTQSSNKPFNLTCPLCEGEHGIYHCKQFLEMTPFVKRKTIAKLNLCSNCLFKHNSKICISTKRCRECNGNHNTILHECFKNFNNSKPISNGNQAHSSQHPEQNQRSTSGTHVSQVCDVPEILLATAIIKIQGADGLYHSMRALIDQGSQLSLITEKAAQILSLPRQKCKDVISGVGIKESSCKGQISINCASQDENYKFSIEALVMKNLTRNLPNYSFRKQALEHLEHIKLADPDFNISRPVDILLGAEVYSEIILEGICRTKQTSLVAQQTRLGWILCGNVNTLQCNVVLNTSSIDQFEKFWEIEDISEDQQQLSSEDIECLNFYKETTKRLEDGKYEVRLPLKQNFEEQLGSSKSKAIAQFLQIERKFQKQSDISQDYKQFINEYIALGHMKLSLSNSKLECFLPHHCVIREGSLTTALRVVFNAKSLTSSGKSLNDLMARGPNLQQDLQSLILKWRQYEIAFTADIEKMFRQIWIHQDDQKLQKIIWRENPTEPLKEYQLCTITYGQKASPFLAMMTLKQLARDEKEHYKGSQAPKVIEECFFMDDLLHGAHSIQEAKQLKQDLIDLLASGGFNLRKWASNESELLDNNVKADTNQQFEFKQAESRKTLGLCWKPQEDYFTFESKIETNENKKITKRTLLSNISKIFDPLGWLTPITTKLKLLFQQVWQNNLNWDDDLPQEIITEWIKIRHDIKNINNISIPRWLGTTQTASIELHGFCDASMKAYGCVIYCKILTNNQPKVVLVVAKARIVSEKKKHTLPRLELCGAELLSKLMSKVQACLKEHELKVYGWTDSTAVLGWLQGDISRWKPFVAHRVEKISNTMSPECWRYVKSADNPADCASRGITASQLLEHSLWWKGPTWLSSYNTEKEKEPQVFQTDEEVKKSKQVHVVVQQDNDVINQLLTKYSSFKKLVRVLSWVRRFLTKNQNRESNQYLTLQEMEAATRDIIKHTQQAEFSMEISKLQTSEALNTNSKILNLNPFLDQNGILRVGGRLRNASISEEMKNPIIIPHDSSLTKLLINQAHTLTFHGGARLTLSYLRRKYWIVGGNRAVKKQLHTCITCKKHKSSKESQIMGDLPAARTSPSRPFYHTGVDFTGYVYVKTNKGRGVKTTKGYIAVFICMVTKAVHLELVSDMSSAAFLAALRRLAARRGSPRHIYSDNGTNFVGANKTLQHEFINLKQIIDPDFHNEITEMNILWHFQAPSWPSASGIWESAVKSLKYHLRRVLGEQKLTYEEFATLLSQLEACLNSRPLCAITEDPDDINYLTPSHFLACGPTLTIIETERDERTRWHLTQKIFKDIWQRWHVEYLTQLSARSKWKQPKENIKINDVVLIQDANLPPGKWSMGRVIELHPGKDGYVRVVTLKTKNGILKRPIVKLSILPISNQRPQTPQQVEQQIISPTGNQKTQATLQSEQERVTSTSDAPRARRQCTRNRKPASKQSAYYVTILLAVIYYMTMITSCFCQNIVPLNENRGLYFDKVANMQLIRDEWKIIVYYDMYPYWEGTSAYIKYSEHLESTCMKIKNQTHCEVIMLQLNHAFTELQYYNSLLMMNRNIPTRRRRGLVNGIGSIARSLFGVLDEQFAEQYSHDINLIKQNENHLARLWKNQTSIVEAEYNLLKRTELNIQKQHKMFNQHIITLEQSYNTMQKEVNKLEYVNEFILSTLSANNMLYTLKTIQDTLLDIITNVYNGKFNIHLITPQQLQNELNTISGQLSKDLSLPISNIQADLQSIYHLLKIRARMTEEYFIFEIKLPLINRDNYDLYKLITIPKQVGSNMVTLVPISDYVGMNLQKDSYLPVTQEEFQLCILHDETTYFCHLRTPIYKMKADTDLCSKNPRNECHLRTKLCENKWINLNNINTFFYFCCHRCQLRNMCGDQVTASQLSGTNIISLSDNCIIKTDNFTVYTHKNLKSTLKIRTEIQHLEVPQINNIINVTLQTMSNESIANTETEQLLKDLGQRIEKLKTNEILTESISSHDIHHYAVSYGIVVVAIAIWVGVLWRRRRRARRQPQAAAGDEEAASVAAGESAPRPQPVIATPAATSEPERIAPQKLDKWTTPILKKVVFRENSV